MIDRLRSRNWPMSYNKTLPISPLISVTCKKVRMNAVIIRRKCTAGMCLLRWNQSWPISPRISKTRWNFAPKYTYFYILEGNPYWYKYRRWKRRKNERGSSHVCQRERNQKVLYKAQVIFRSLWLATLKRFITIRSWSATKLDADDDGPCNFMHLLYEHVFAHHLHHRNMIMWKNVSLHWRPSKLQFRISQQSSRKCASSLINNKNMSGFRVFPLEFNDTQLIYK